ncbi:MAG TPA: hypothetical protein PKE04_07990 [Clostridia bacterium]|nr:hypothetical protein [Clostridia bacterium]
MSRNRGRILLLLLLAAAVLIPVWAASESILPEALRVPEVVNDNTATVRRDRFVKMANGSGTVVYPKTVHLSVQEGEGVFVKYLVRKGAEVKAGDVLATFTRDPQTVKHETLKLQLTRAEEALDQGKADREEDMAKAREALALLADSTDRQVATLRLRKMELALEKYAAEQERNIEGIRKQLTELEELLADTAIVAPFDGIIETVTTKSEGDVVWAGETLLTLYAPEYALLRVSDSNLAFRYGMQATIQGGSRNDPTMLQGQVVAASNLLPYELRQQAAYLLVDDMKTLVSLRNLTASVETLVLEDVLVVPRSALTMQGGVYYAQILTEDMVQKRYVATSNHRLTDLLILQGLEEGQTVLID